MKAILFIFVMVTISISQANVGKSLGTTGCEKLSISDNQIEVVNTGGCQIFRDGSGQGKRTYFGYFDVCPRPFKNMYVYLKSNFMKTSSEKSESDLIEISNKKSCLYQEIEDMFKNQPGKSQIEIRLGGKVEKGSLLTVLTKMGFYKLRSKDNIWTYHLTPGVSVDIEITGESCGKSICLEENKQKIHRIVGIYKDFIRMDKSGNIYYSSALDSKAHKVNSEK